jgi:Uma2 family endonuclease
MSAAIKTITADDLLAMGDIGRCELIYGELVMMSPAGVEHGVVVGRLFRYIFDFVEQHDLGVTCAAETGFKIESNPDLVRAPDVSIIRKGRLRGKIPKGFFDGVPDLAVEVISPNDRQREVAEKANMWLAYGTVSVWIADPSSMTLSIRRAGRKAIRLTIKDELKDEPALPGLVVAVARIFKHF